jgi:hypothetical protein
MTEKKFTIKIEGRADYSDETRKDLKQVETFDNHVNQMFRKYEGMLRAEFEKAQLSYDIKDEETKEVVDPYLSSFSFDTVTKDVK